MSSATRSNPTAASALVYNLPMPGKRDAEEAVSKVGNLGMSPRQLELDRFWRRYRCVHYEGRSIDWNGHQELDPVETESITRGNAIPPGFYDAGQTMPLKFRKPSAIYNLDKAIVDRFTGLLFSAKRHPNPSVPDDDATEDWLEGFCADTRLWFKMILARTYGGAMGSVGISFKFLEGRPVVEVHDPRWSEPELSDDGEERVERLEKRYIFERQLRDPETGSNISAEFWYRRVIDRFRDRCWPAVPVGDGEEPDWDDERWLRTEVFHNFGFCPVVWIKNTPDQERADGDPDTWGMLELSDRMDELYSQANRGTVSNCDPSVLVSSDAEFDSFRKGSENAIQVEKGGSATYMEITGAGPKAAVDLADKFRERALEIARCVLDTNFAGPARTESETNKNYSAMIERADEFREAYGEGLRRFFEMVVRAVRRVGEVQIVKDEAGEPVSMTRGEVRLTKRRVEDEETGEAEFVEREVGSGEVIEIEWPDYFEPTHDDTEKATRAAGQAFRSFGLISRERALRYVARYFGVENIREEAEKAKEEGEQASLGGLESGMFGFGGEGGEE